jgi:hypothetical protein
MRLVIALTFALYLHGVGVSAHGQSPEYAAAPLPSAREAAEPGKEEAAPKKEETEPKKEEAEPKTEAGEEKKEPAPNKKLFRAPSEPPLGAAGKSRVPQPEKQSSDDFVPIPDRWRMGFPTWNRYGPRSDAPYRRGNWLNPYRQNVLKGDYPILGHNTFLNLTLTNDTFLETRRLPVPSGVSAQNPGSFTFFGRGAQFAFANTFFMSLDLFHGDAAYKPRDWDLRITPAVNVNYLNAREKGIVNIDVRKGTDRTDAHVALDELFGEVKLRDLSPAYDFLSVRGGIQSFTSDFRGFIFSDEGELGLRLFGNSQSNRNQYNLAFFSQLEKDTNSGLNTLRSRGQEVLIANFYRQDLFSLGYTGQLSFHYSHDHGARHFDDNGFLVRPAPFGEIRDHDVRSYYLGWTGDGHFGPLNINHAFYQVFGKDDFNAVAGRPVSINAQMGALELSVDRDWLRYKASFFYASGDDNPRDGRGRGFDAIFDNPRFAGGDFSFWNAQGIRLTSTGVALVNPFSLLPDLRSSKIEGQANFVNPGVFLYNLGVDADVTPKMKASFNLNYLQFAKTQSLEVALKQAPIRRGIGLDANLGVRYRPLLNDNIITQFGASAFIPSHGFEDIFRTRTLYSFFTTLTLTF